MNPKTLDVNPPSKVFANPLSLRVNPTSNTDQPSKPPGVSERICVGQHFSEVLYAKPNKLWLNEIAFLRRITNCSATYLCVCYASGHTLLKATLLPATLFEAIDAATQSDTKHCAEKVPRGQARWRLGLVRDIM